MASTVNTDYPSTGSTIDRRIRTGLSPLILVRVNGEAVGAIQTLNPTETRQVARVQELGTDGVIELVPNSPTNVTLQVTRLVFDNLRLPPAFRRGFAHIQAQRLPFDIDVFDRTHGLQSPNISMQITSYRNCYFANYSSSYQANNYQITENATIEAQYVEDLHPVTASVNERGLSPDVNYIENLANTGIRLGTLDFPDLIDEYWKGGVGEEEAPPQHILVSYSLKPQRSVAWAHGRGNIDQAAV